MSRPRRRGGNSALLAPIVLAYLEDATAEYVTARDDYHAKTLTLEIARAKLQAIRDLADRLPDAERAALIDDAHDRALSDTKG